MRIVIDKGQTAGSREEVAKDTKKGTGKYWCTVAWMGGSHSFVTASRAVMEAFSKPGLSVVVEFSVRTFRDSMFPGQVISLDVAGKKYEHV